MVQAVAQVSIPMPMALRRQILAAAQRQDRSASSWLREAAREKLARDADSERPAE